jgi:hypothetical protein
VARARNIKPGFFKNEFLAEMDPATRLLFIGLWTLADREGRLEDRPMRVRAELFAFDVGMDINPMLDRLAGAGFLIRYEVKGKRFIQIENFTKHQQPHYKEVASEIPPPPGRKNSPATPGAPAESVRQAVFDRDGRKCLECGSTEGLSLDHIKPRAKGGSHAEDNLRTLCGPCNSKKRDRELRADVGPTSAQCRGDIDSTKVPHDPLNPDSLIPDSLNPLTDSVGLGVPLPFQTPTFATAWGLWETHRREKGVKLTETSVRQQFGKLLAMGEARAIAAIEHSVEKGYQGIYEPSGHSPHKRAGPRDRDAELMKQIREAMPETP